MDRLDVNWGGGLNLFIPQQFPHWTKIPSKICTTASVVLTSESIKMFLTPRLCPDPLRWEIVAHPVNTVAGFKGPYF